MTGGTGFLGKKVAHILNNDERVDLQVLSRSKNTKWTGNLTLWNAGLDLKELKKEKFDVFLHLAGLYDLDAQYRDIIINNVFGTNTALKLTQELEIPLFINASSVAAASNMSGPVSPYDSNLISPFPDPYSEGKALTEVQIRNWPNKSVKKVNLRLGILIGDSKTGTIERIDGPYKALRGFEKIKKYIESWPGGFFLPGNENVSLPFVPVDIAASAIVSMMNVGLNNLQPNYFSYHITPEKGVRLRDFYNSIMHHLSFSKCEYTLVKELPKEITATLASKLFEFPKEQLRYALNLPDYSSIETTQVLGEDWCPEFSNYESIFWSGYEKFISNS